MLTKTEFTNELNKMTNEQKTFAIKLFNNLSNVPDKMAAKMVVDAMARHDWYLMTADWAIELYQNVFS